MKFCSSGNGNNGESLYPIGTSASAATGSSSSTTSQHQLAVLVDGIATSLNIGVDLETSSRRSTFRLDDALSVFDPLTSGETEMEESQNGAILPGGFLLKFRTAFDKISNLTHNITYT